MFQDPRSKILHRPGKYHVNANALSRRNAYTGNGAEGSPSPLEVLPWPQICALEKGARDLGKEVEAPAESDGSLVQSFTEAEVDLTWALI